MLASLCYSKSVRPKFNPAHEKGSQRYEDKVGTGHKTSLPKE